jgi:hypothetical protein
MKPQKARKDMHAHFQLQQPAPQQSKPCHCCGLGGATLMVPNESESLPSTSSNASTFVVLATDCPPPALIYKQGATTRASVSEPIDRYPFDSKIDPRPVSSKTTNNSLCTHVCHVCDSAHVIVRFPLNQSRAMGNVANSMASHAVYNRYQWLPYRYWSQAPFHCLRLPCFCAD